MDNQNPMNGGMPQGQGQYGGQNTPPQNQNGDPQSSVVVQPGLDNLENVQTQSVVESAREEAEKELEQVRAYNEALVRQQKAQENATKAKKTSVTIFGVIIFIVLLGVIAWLVVNAIILAQGPAGPGKDSEVIDPAQLAEIDGYKCTTTNCAKVVDLPDGRIIIRDTAYYIYDLEEKEATLTSIEEKDYHAITPFYWGDRLLAELDPESDASALYSITENRALTSYNFDTIYRDINDDVYKNQTSIKGSYIKDPVSLQLDVDFAEKNLVANGKIKTRNDNIALNASAPKQDLTQLKASGTKKVNTATAITVNEAFAASHLLIF